MGKIITLITDFGPSDGYVAAMKGVILSINPGAQIVDITHQVAPQDIRGAAFILSTIYSFFPPETIHVAVVDPGVGTQRKALIVQTSHGFFVGPDNGILSYILQDDLRCPISVPSNAKLININNPRFWHHPISQTFHGRDIFAPVAAHLSLGEPLANFGDPVQTMVTLPSFRFQRGTDGTVRGEIVHIDNFGNLITSIKPEDLPYDDVLIKVKDITIKGLLRSYGEAERFLAIRGSSGYLEIALKNGHAAEVLRASVGDVVEVTKTRNH